MPVAHPITVRGFDVWAKNVEKATEGKIKILVFPGDILAAGSDAYDATKSGACDMAQLIQPYEPERFRLSMVMNQPLGLPNAVVSGKVAWDLYRQFPEIQAEYKDVKLLFFYSTSAYQIHTAKKPVPALKDLRGLLVRVGDVVDRDIAEALKMAPEFLPMPDTYLALERGVLDALMSAFGPMKGFKTVEVTRYHLENADFHTSIFGVIMNLKKWNSLPPPLQQAIEKVSGSEAGELFGRVFDETDADTINDMRDKGDVFFRLSAEDQSRLEDILADIQKKWVEDNERRGLPGRRILDEALRLKARHSEGEYALK